MEKTKQLTLKRLGHDDCNGRYRLSNDYRNSRNNYKVVEDTILGYTIIGDGMRGPVRIAPIYRASIWRRDGKLRSVIETYEIGAYYNSSEFEAFGESLPMHAIGVSIQRSIAALTHLSENLKRRDK